MTKASEATHVAWKVFALIALLGFTFTQMRYYVIPNFNSLSGLTDIQKVGLIWPPIIGYVLVALCAHLLASILRPTLSFRMDGHGAGIIFALALSSQAGWVILLPAVTIGLIFGKQRNKH